MRSFARFILSFVFVVLAFPWASSVRAEDVGSVASVVDSVERGRADVWQPLALGDGVAVGDRVRTDDSGRVRLVFADGSVLVVGGGSEVTIDENVYQPEDASATSVFGLLKGKLRAVVSEHYRTGGTFEVKTPTAVSGVRGTDFIVQHPADDGATEVVGVSGTVEVTGVAVPGVSVFLTSRQISRVLSGGVPSEPETLSERRFRDYLDDLEFVTQDAPESLLFDKPNLVEGAVPEPERPLVQAGEPGGPAQLDVDRLPPDVDETIPDAAGVAGQPADAVDSGDLGIRF